MAVVFLLGPSEWDPDRGRPAVRSPMAQRLELSEQFRRHGHAVLLMEEIGDRPGEDLVDKFDRILGECKVTDIVVLWPKGAKMQTTYDELLLLRDRAARKLPAIWVLHHRDVADIRQGVFALKERGGRSRYLDAVARLGVSPLPWSTLPELRRLARRLGREMAR